MKKIIKYVFLIFCGIAGAFIVSETIMQIIKPPMLFDKAKHCDSDTSVFETSTDNIDFFKYLYVDIYDDYFQLEDNIYTIKRITPLAPNAKKNESFNKTKNSGTKRIFIIGESVAEIFPKDTLLAVLKKYIPDTNFEIINAGAGSYESYRIKRIAKEAVKYKTDYIVVLMGNNDGIFNPVEINYFPYKYKLFRTSYVFNRLSNWFVKRYFFDRESGFSFFQKNVISIIKYAENKSKVIFVTLPRNSIHTEGKFEFQYPEIDQNSTDSQKQYYEQRRIFLRNLPNKYSWVSVADYDFVLKKHIGKYLGYNVFLDSEHYWLNMYDLISKLIAEQIAVKPVDIDKNYIDDLIIENEKEIQKRIFNIEGIYNSNDINVFSSDDYGIFCDTLKKLYIFDKKLFEQCISKALEDNRSNLINSAVHILIMLKEYKEALRYLDKFLQKSPDDYKSYILKALVYYKLGERKLSEECFDHAKKINPKNRFNLKHLDDFYESKKKSQLIFMIY